MQFSKSIEDLTDWIGTSWSGITWIGSSDGWGRAIGWTNKASCIAEVVKRSVVHGICYVERKKTSTQNIRMSTSCEIAVQTSLKYTQLQSTKKRPKLIYIVCYDLIDGASHITWTTIPSISDNVIACSRLRRLQVIRRETKIKMQLYNKSVIAICIHANIVKE